jgi:hypothetical protein
MTNEQKRLANIEQLKKLDRNGVWTDEQNILEGFEPLTLEQTEQYIHELTNNR